jgi:CBS domain-containing protein
MRGKCALPCRDEGSVAIEVAILVGIVVLLVFGAMQFLGAQSEQSFALVANRAFNRSMTESRTETERHSDSLAESVESGKEIRRRQITIDLDQLLLIFACVLVMGWQSLKRRRLNILRAIEKTEADRQLMERLDNKRFVKRQEILKVLSVDPNALLEDRIEARHLMTTRLRTVDPKTSLDEMKTIMADEHVRHFPVLCKDGTLVGIVSDRDLLNQNARVAAEVMARKLTTITPTTKINSAVFEIITRNISCLPVMDGEKLVGILTTTDLVMTLQCAFQLWQRRPNVPGPMSASSV